ncbi:hypothetical protein FQN52_001151 [Onygenales sp. PD_12]|nr:hypothetical protein FQN52_001151 [Onygenales sp. PD_12]
MVHLTSLLMLSACIAHATSSVIGTRSSTKAIRQEGSLPSSFEWSSSGALVGPKDDDRHLAGIKDPSVIYYEDKYHVFASTAQQSGYNLVYISFTDLADAPSADFFYLDQSPIGTGYRAAPEVFFFEPQGLWYLVYQNGNAAYSTNPDINDPVGWTAPKTFYSDIPSTVTENMGNGNWVDMWVICDEENCHLFSSDDNGHLYRSQTAVADFPNGFNEPEITLSDPDKNKLFEAANVYSYGANQYLLIVEAIGSAGRYFRSWTAGSLEGDWTPLADTEENPFAGANNVAFEGEAWTASISHGEVVRTEVDQKLAISPCDIKYLYQGVDPAAGGDYNSLPWKLGLLTQTNSAC